MRNQVTACLTALLLCSPAAADEVEDLAADGKSLIEQFGGALKAELVAAMKEGGPVNAIGVCNSRAPGIGAEITRNSDGWTITRSSHRLRNPGNAPDKYTEQAIAAFQAREKAGESVAEMAKAEIVVEDGRRTFRMVKAIPTGAVCLTCHGGDEVPPEVVAVLKELYPDDAARGFSEGEMRGVFSLRKPLD